MKKFRSIIILLAVLLVLLAVYFFASPMWSEDEADETTAEQSYQIAEIDHTLLVGFELNHGEENLSFALNDKATEWNWSKDAEIPLDNMAFANIVTALNNAKSKYKLEGVSTEQLAEYGLDEPDMTVKFTFSDGTAKEYFVGDLNSFNGNYYLSESGAPNTVYMIEAAVKTSLELDIHDFVLEETPPAITEAKILGVDYYNSSFDSRIFRYYPAGNNSDYTDRYEWYFGKGIDSIHTSTIPHPATPLRTDLGDSLSALVTGLFFDECVGLDYTSGDFGFSESRKIIVHYNAEEGETGVLQKKEYVVYLGLQREDGSIYAHTDTSKLVYTLSSPDEWLGIISVEETKLYPDEIWLPNYELIDSMTFTAGNNSITVKVKNTDGKTSFSSDASDDVDAISALVKALEDMKVKSNVAYLDTPATGEEKSEIFSVKVTFSSYELSEVDIVVKAYSNEYCIVNFDSLHGRLVTLEDAEKLVAMISGLKGA